ncbi:MAG: RND family efflux transporter MFP subunit [Parcubacteria group bacterium GW2011_GWA2_51_10]|nr:MAG: RND family efflux transporter MFP subunit [Parcubacteria group bacterium GW2011_GWA2_51_10]
MTQHSTRVNDRPCYSAFRMIPTLLRVKAIVAAHPYISSGVAIAFVGSILWFANSRDNNSNSEYATVTRGTVSQTVSVTGKVVPASEADLSFDRSGRVGGVYHAVGDRVAAGTLLVSLESGELSAQLEAARATVRAHEARLAELLRGARAEDINVSEVEVRNAIDDVVNDLKSAEIKADDAIRNKVDQLFSNPRSNSPQLKILTSNSQLEIDIEAGRVVVEAMLESWHASLSNAFFNANMYQYIGEAKANLRTLQRFLDQIALAVNTLSPSSTLSQTTIDSYKADTLAARTNITSELSGLTASEEKLANAESKLALKKAGSTQESLAAQQAEVDAAKANVSNLEAQLGKTVIRSPIAGVVTKMEAKRGEIAVSGSDLVSVISDARYEVEAFVPEADIAKIRVGNDAEVTLDAYGSGVVFEATVVKIDPAETIIDGVATYKTALQFKKYDARVKPGMTANTDIEGEKREDVLFVPGRAISQKGTDKTVQVLEGETVREVKVETGIRGSSGDVEIVSGLNEGDKVKI